MSPTALGNGTLPRGPLRIPKVMIPATRAFQQPARSGAHGFRSHRLRSSLMVCKYCRIRTNSFKPFKKFKSFNATFYG
jgi:hypothetical protein